MKLLTRREELVLLAIWKLKDNAYCVPILDLIEEFTGKKWTLGSIYIPLYRLERMGYLESFLGEPTTEMIIPQTAVDYTLDGTYVYRAINHKAIKTPVTLGLKLDDNKVIVTKGLKAGDIVIIGSQVKLQPNAPIMTPQEMQQMLQHTQFR